MSYYISIITDKGTGKRIKISDLEKTSRAKRGLLILREVKTNPYRIVKTLVTNSRDFIGIKTSDIKIIKASELPIMDRYSTGSTIIKGNVIDAFMNVTLTKKKDLVEEVSIKEEKPEKRISLKEIDDKLMTIDDFIDIDA